MTTGALRVLNLQADNYKRLRAVEITPSGDLVQITGRNGQGKTSVLDALWAALSGGDVSRQTPKPIREGASTAQVRVDLGEYVVTRRWTKDGPGTLTVEAAAGGVLRSPQAVLDALLGRFAFDPLAFTQQSGKEQVATLIAALGDSLGFDPAELDEERAALYADRTDANREVKRAEERVRSLGDPADDLPDEPVSVSALLAELAEIDEEHAARNAAIDQLSYLARRHRDANERVKAAEAALNSAREEEATVARERIGQQQRIDAMPVERDRKPILDRLEQAEEINEEVRLAARIREADAQAQAAVAAANALDRRIREIDERKAAGLAAASFPVEGLSFDDGGVTYRGVPFSQASTSEQLRVSVGIAMAMNPRLRVLRIDRAEALDSDGLRLIADMAGEQGYQVWLSRVDESGAVGIQIEDGEVVGG